jgi:HAD superfamily hydrolase (TIGR01509 family)
VIRPRAVIFDMDGVLLDSEPVYRACWQRASRELGCSISDALYARLLGRMNGDAERILIEELGHSFPLEEFRLRWDRYWDQCIETQPIPLKRGVPEFLDFLEARGIHKAIATSTERTKAMRSLGGLQRRFEVIVTGDQIERGKPEPDIFLAAAKQIGVTPAQCLVIEDSEPGVRAAHAGGMPVVLVPDLREPDASLLSMVVGTCRSIDEVIGLLGGNEETTTS